MSEFDRRFSPVLIREPYKYSNNNRRYLCVRGIVIFSACGTISRAACLLAVLFLAACSSTGKTTSTSATSATIPRNTTAVLSVKANLAKDHRYKDKVLETLREKLSSELVAEGIFKSVSVAPASGDYQVDVEVTRIRVVTPGGRVMFGFMAGRNSVRVLVGVRKTTSGESVRSFETTGYGASIGWGAQSYGADDPVREVVKLTIDELQF